MNRKWLTRIGVALLVLAGLVAVGGLAFRAGQHHDEVRDHVVGDEGVRTVVVSGWRHVGPGFGFGFGFLFFPLLIVGLILLFNSPADAATAASAAAPAAGAAIRGMIER